MRALVMLLALFFIITLDSSCGNLASNVSCLENEREALIKFKENLIDEANRLRSWAGKDCCTWKGVVCSRRTGHVMKLDLRNPITFDFDTYVNYTTVSNYRINMLGGEISPSLVDLKHLSYLDLSRNYLSGVDFLGSLKSLRYLNLSSNLVGKVPHNLGNLSRLQYLDLNSNDLAGPIPNTLERLTSLTVLDLSDNHFNNTMPFFICNLSSLSVLKLAGNRLEGPLPSCMGNMTQLTVLDLNTNSLVGPIPNTLGRLTSLTVLDLSYNGLNGTINVPFFICNLSRLSVLKLTLNMLEGPLPSCTGNMTQLTVLELSVNEFEGEIPNSMKNLCSLRILDLSWNNFGGEILTSAASSPLYGCIRTSLKELNLGHNLFTGRLLNHLGEFKNLERLVIYSNSFSGPLPSSLGRLSYLRELDARGNQLNGTIPVGLGQLSNLQSLDLSYNSLNGTIPVGLGQLSNLQSLYLSYNSLNGTIPVGLGQLSNLQSLDLSYNSFGGMLYEQHFTTLKSLKKLSLSSNSLNISVSSQWVPPFQLQILEMASCPLGPKFPTWLQTQRHVMSLNMSNASISDIMPDWFEHMSSCIKQLDISNNHMRGKLPKFQTKCNDSASFGRDLILRSNKFDGPLSTLPSSTSLLDLSDNLLSGPIPVGNYSGIEFLSLSNNHFSGVIPVSLCSAATTEIIDLSKNRLSGRIPRCLGNLGELDVLDLSSNSLHGHIPSSLGFLQQLEYLHLRNNRFHGELPLSLQNLTSIFTLDLGENAFTGVIPPWIGDKLSGLIFLSLQSNNFYGSIPVQLCHLSALQLLNLAHNNITGDIPSCFHNFTAMVALEHENYYAYDSIYHRGYEDSILITIKGRELEYKKILKFVNSIDLSTNGITGEIPEGLTALLGLLNLNLSGNHLTGRIPEKIGNLNQLESLDLSRNKLFGSIPYSLSNLSSLSRLNLSFNNLSGRIPTGNQLQTLDDWSIYAGNDGLCGAPLTKSCPGHKVLVSEGNKEDDETELLWFCAGLGPGFVVGWLGFFFTLYFKRKWRHLYFQFVEDSYSRIFVAIVVRANRLRRKFHPQRQIGEE